MNVFTIPRRPSVMATTPQPKRICTEKLKPRTDSIIIETSQEGQQRRDRIEKMSMATI